MASQDRRRTLSSMSSSASNVRSQSQKSGSGKRMSMMPMKVEKQGRPSMSASNSRQSLGGQQNRRQTLGGGGGASHKSNGSSSSSSGSGGGGSSNSSSSSSSSSSSRSSDIGVNGEKSRRSSIKGRRSSAYGKGGQLQDPRPIGDKNFQQQNIKTLITYLTSHMYDKPISKQLLMAPTSKDFRHIITFLFKQVDPNFEFGDKYEDEVKMFMKEFGYPIAISKQSLYAVGSPHTWPPLLAALVWLIEFLSYSEEVEQKEDMNIADNPDKVLFEYTGQAYQKFLDGEDNFQVLEEDLQKMFQMKNKNVNEEIHRLRQANEALQTEINMFKSTQSDMAELTSKRAYYLSDVQKFNKLIEQVKAHKDSLLQKLDEKKADMKQRQDDLTNIRAEKDQLEITLSQQEITPFEVQRMNHNKQMHEEMLLTLQKQKEHIQGEIWNQEMAVNKKLEDVETNVRAFNEHSVKLELIPSSAKNAMGVDFEIRVNTKSYKPEEILNVDLTTVIKTALNGLKAEASKKILAAQNDIRDSRERAVVSSEQKVEIADKVAGLDVRRNKLDETFKQEREQLNNNLKQIVAEIEDMEFEVHRLKATQTNSVEHSEKQLMMLEKEYVDAESTHAAERQAISDEICAVMDEVASHKAQIEDTLKAMEGRAKQIRETLLEN